MKTVAIFNLKGGSGRTTLTVHLARRAQAQSLDTVAVSLDRSGDLLSWLCQGRQNGVLEAQVCGEHLAALHSPDKVPQPPLGASLVVYDCPPTVEILAELKPDLWIVPVRPGRASDELVGRVLRELSTSGAEILVVGWCPRPNQEAAWLSALRDTASQSPRAQVWERAIAESESIAHAEATYSVAWDAPDADEGARELASLCDGVLAFLGLVARTR